MSIEAISLDARNETRLFAAPNAWAPKGWELVQIGGLPIAILDCRETADLMVRSSMARRGRQLPALCHTSANGQVISMCAVDPALKSLYEASELISADGMPMIFASRWLTNSALPERVATTDLFHAAARRAEETGARFYFMGATEQSNARAVDNVRRQYPNLVVAGRHHGYFSEQDEPAVIEEINAAAPDILWVALGAPREHTFAVRYRERLHNVGLIKTSGGLFDFLSGANRRAPRWIQDLGLEWAFRTWLEPRRLFIRYLLTNPHAIYVILTRSRDLRLDATLQATD